MAYCGLVFEHYHRRMTKLWQIVLLMASCGFFWEYITPLFRPNTQSQIRGIFWLMCVAASYIG